MTLQRRTPLRAQPRSKGARAERAVIDLLKSKGWRGAYRNESSGAFGGGDIIGGPVGVNLEVKHHERCDIWAWIRQCEHDARPTDLPLVVCRRNLLPFWGVMTADELDALLELRPALRTATVIRLENGRCRLWDWIADARELAGLEAHLVPVVRFSRPGGRVYAGAPADVVFDLLAELELA